MRLEDFFTIFGVFSLFLFFIIFYLWTTYNSFIGKRNQIKTDFADVAVQIKRRASLIERLAYMVKEYASHEKETFEHVAQARAALDNSKTVEETAKAENMLSATLRSLFAVVENYPKLQANQNYLSLQKDLKETEDRVAGYREDYNRSVQEYNNTIQTFPNLIAALLFKFYDEDYFQA